VGGEKYACLPGLVPDAFRYPCQMFAYAPLNPAIRSPWEILVNARGERFVQEDHSSVHHIERGVYQQPAHRHWAIFDAAMLEKSDPIIPKWDRERLAQEHKTNAMFHSAMSIEALALTAGLNPVALQNTVDDYNRRLEAGETDTFGRKARPMRLITPPYYSIAMQGWTLVSFAGLKVSAELQVMRDEGSVIPNLYAIGEVIGAGATSGAAYTNGMLVTPAITFGRLLGARLANTAPLR
jgi:fumarate reductase flavoprotein subunit